MDINRSLTKGNGKITVVGNLVDWYTCAQLEDKTFKFTLAYPFDKMEKGESVEFTKSCVHSEDVKAQIRQASYYAARKGGFKVSAIMLPNGRFCIRRTG